MRKKKEQSTPENVFGVLYVLVWWVMILPTYVWLTAQVTPRNMAELVFAVAISVLLALCWPAMLFGWLVMWLASIPL